jgi:prepilin-type N-terminal cleavage/methylation domain-containing protein
MKNKGFGIVEVLIVLLVLVIAVTVFREQILDWVFHIINAVN